MAAMIPNKKDFVAKVGRVGAAQVVGLLAIVLRREDPERTCCDVVCVRNAEGMGLASVIQDRPKDSTDLSGTGGTVEAFNSNSGGLGRCHKIIQGIGDTGGGRTINKNVERVGVKDGLSRSSPRDDRLRMRNVNGNCRKGQMTPAPPGTACPMAPTPPRSMTLAPPRGDPFVEHRTAPPWKQTPMKTETVPHMAGLR